MIEISIMKELNENLLLQNTLFYSLYMFQNTWYVYFLNHNLLESTELGPTIQNDRERTEN